MKERIKELRNFLEMTQEEFGAALEVEKNSVYRWEAGIHPPAAKTIKKMCGLFAVRKEWIIAGDGPMQENALGTGEDVGRENLSSCPGTADGHDVYIPDRSLTKAELELVRMLLHVLRGRWGGGYEKSLEQNVRSFYHACQVEEETQLPPAANDFKTGPRNHSSGGGGNKG